MKIHPITTLPNEFDRLMLDAESEGHDFLTKIKREWASYENRFDRPHEALFEVRDDQGHLIGIGGLNVDPYVDDPHLGRVRHVFVRPQARGSGVGRALVQKIIEHATGHFKLLRLRTHNPQAVDLYRKLQFVIVENANDPTHIYMERTLAAQHQ